MEGTTNVMHVTADCTKMPTQGGTHVNIASSFEDESVKT
jgi:hypothetical protein